MTISLHNIKSIKTKSSNKKLGRGLGSGKGRYSGKGLKGQRSRSGGKSGLKRLGMKANMQSIPKLPGFNSLKAKLEVVNIEQVNKVYKTGEKVNATTLKNKGLIDNSKVGVKILGNGKIDKKLVFIVDKVSKTAQEAIEKAGGTIKLITRPVKVKLTWEERQKKEKSNKNVKEDKLVKKISKKKESSVKKKEDEK